MNFMMYWWGINFFKNMSCFMVNELSQYDMVIPLNKSGLRNIEL